MLNNTRSVPAGRKEDAAACTSGDPLRAHVLILAAENIRLVARVNTLRASIAALTEPPGRER